MAAGPDPVRQVDMARDLGIAPATLSRIVKVLSERGYLLRTREKHCVRNFRLIRNVPMSENYLSLLNTLMEEITATHRVSVEAVVVTGFDLLWHARTELPDPTVAIRARMGSRRSLYELDAYSRLFLSRMPPDQLAYRFTLKGFFTSGVDMQSLTADAALALIHADRGKHIDIDFDGNHVGVRRFATVIEDAAGRFLHLLGFAEAATPVKDRQVHVTERLRVLEQARTTLHEHIHDEARDDPGSDITEAGVVSFG